MYNPLEVICISTINTSQSTASGFTRVGWVCPICKNDYPSIKDMHNCLTKCLAKQEAEEREAKQRKLDEEQSARRDEISKKLDELTKLINQYNRDYKEKFRWDSSDPLIYTWFDSCLPIFARFTY